MTAEDIRSAACLAHIAQRKLKDAVGAGVVIPVGMLRSPHAPDHCPWPVIRQRPRNPRKLGTRNTGYPFCFFRGPGGHFLADLIHTPDALADEFSIFPFVFEDMPQQPPDQANVRAGPEPHKFIGMGRRAGKAWITNDQRRIVHLLRLQQVKQGNRMSFGRVAPDHEDRA